MDRRKFITQTMVSTAAVVGSPFFLSSCSKPSKRSLTILHTNDMHSQIDPFPEDSAYAGLGGMAARSALINEIRSSTPNVLLLDVGDIFQGTPYFNLFGGELEVELMNKMKYDATTVGNHEFDNGMEGLRKGLEWADFPYLSANYDFSNTILKSDIDPYHIFNRGGIKVGVFGLGIELDGLVAPRLFKGTKYLDPIDVSKEMVQQLKREKCDLIVCLSHLGYRYKHSKVSDQVLASEVSEIDLILGGHTHTFMDAPEILTNDQGFKSTINQVGWAGLKLGRIDVVIGDDDKLAFMHNQFTVGSSLV